ncbi:transposable element Tcb2 transposase [Trichonephila clavipes]|nr:transposable element Tcb2 transposase [Trichonephila clavipes]
MVSVGVVLLLRQVSLMTLLHLKTLVTASSESDDFAASSGQGHQCRRIEPTTYGFAQVALSLGNPVSSRTIRRRRAEGQLGSRCQLRVLPLTKTHRRLRFEWCHARGNWNDAEWNQEILTMNPDSTSAVMTIVFVWGDCGERLNPVFALQRHTTSTAGVMV